jgi:hypothetical protein
METSSSGPAALTDLLVQALRAESAARVADSPALLAAAIAQRRHLNLLLGVDPRANGQPTSVSLALPPG